MQALFINKKLGVKMNLLSAVSFLVNNTYSLFFDTQSSLKRREDARYRRLLEDIYIKRRASRSVKKMAVSSQCIPLNKTMPTPLKRSVKKMKPKRTTLRDELHSSYMRKSKEQPKSNTPTKPTEKKKRLFSILTSSVRKQMKLSTEILELNLAIPIHRENGNNSMVSKTEKALKILKVDHEKYTRIIKKLHQQFQRSR